jgi:hypothetical protein
MSGEVLTASKLALWSARGKAAPVAELERIMTDIAGLELIDELQGGRR